MFRKPVFWIVFGLVFVGCVIFTFKYFSRAFPLVTLDLRMDRETAFDSARDLAEKYDWAVEGFKQAASFGVDGRVQNFVELEAGGQEAFRRMLEEDLYSPYTWRVRHFKEGEINEIHFRFTPQGEPYGFFEKLPEDEPGASLPSDSARIIAETTAAGEWRIDLSAYELVEESQDLRPGGRMDHTFVYERPDVRIGEGRYRLSLTVGGDRLTELKHFIKVPEAFDRRFEQMRSTNETISFGASIVSVVLYILGGCIIGLFFLLRQRWVVWRKPLFWGIFVAFLQVLAYINYFPLRWMGYDTAVPVSEFLLNHLVMVLGLFVGSSIFFTLAFMAAETLTRKAFPGHVQFWRLWSTGTASSPAVLGQTVSGFLFIWVFFAFEVAFYFLARNVLGWWQPSGPLFHPDTLATYFPWLTSIAISLQAGFLEECLFRAVPIAGAVLLGRRFGHSRVWITAAFIIQPLVFGAAHAAYANQPAYARLVELIIPSLIFGGLYYYFGLLPAIILHFGIDVVAIGLPVFVSAAPGIWVDKAIIVLLTLVPLWVVISARLRARRWSEVAAENLNRSWSPPVKEEAPPVEAPVVKETAVIPLVTGRLLPIGGLLGLALWIFAATFQSNSPAVNLGRSKAEELARNALEERSIVLPDSWRELSDVIAPLNQQDRFVWQEGGKENYDYLMNKHLGSPHWYVRYAQFEEDIDIAERAEEYRVAIYEDGKRVKLTHRLPEARPGDSLSEAEARPIVDSVLAANYDFNIPDLKEISAVPSKLPERMDWVFTFADTVNYPLSEGEARVSVDIAGNEAVSYSRWVHVPEEWTRQEREDRSMASIVGNFCQMLIILIFLAGAIVAVVSWSRKNFSASVFFIFFAVLFGLSVIDFINEWPSAAAHFSTAEPLTNQILITIVSSVVGALFLSAAMALLIGFVHRWKSEQPPLRFSRAVLLGCSLGILITGLSAAVEKSVPSLSPFWADYSSLRAYLPILDGVLGLVRGYIIATIAILFIFVAVDRLSNGWTRRKILFSIALVLLGLVNSADQAINGIPFWLISGVAAGVVILLAYRFVVRFHLALIPLIVGTMTILHGVQQGLLQAYPGAVPASILSIVLMGYISVYWYKKWVISEQINDPDTS